jgi:hypothetical protein
MDIVTANYAAHNATVLLGNGDGTFASATAYSVGTNPHSVFSADFNSDGKMDIVSTGPNMSAVKVLENSSENLFSADATTGNVTIGGSLLTNGTTGIRFRGMATMNGDTFCAITENPDGDLYCW